MARFLANENFPGDAVTALRQRGHDVAWVRVECPGASDESVLAKGLAEQRLLLTFDKDFGELVFRRGRRASCGVVLFRMSTPSPAAAVARIVSALEQPGDWIGVFSVVEDARLRQIVLPE